MSLVKFSNTTINSKLLVGGGMYEIVMNTPIQAIEIIPCLPTTALAGVLTFTKGNATVSMNLANGEYYQKVGGIGQMLMTVSGLDKTKRFNITLRCK